MTSESDKPNPPPERKEFFIDPSRLAYGKWNEEKQRDEGEGDVSGSYSGDTIAENGRIRKPFKFDGHLWVTIGTGGGGGIQQAEAYRLVPLKMFHGTPTTYKDKGDNARNDPNGAYDRMTVKSGKEVFVMAGPSAYFIAEQSPERPEPKPKAQQMDLFS